MTVLMSLINKLNDYIMLIIMIVVFLFVMFLLVYFFFLKEKIHGRENRDDDCFYSFKKDKTSTFVPVRDIKGSVMMMDDGKTFISVMKCRGFDFYNATEAEQMSVSAGYLGFINTITDGMQLRVVAEKMDMSDTLRLHREALKKKEEELKALYLETSELLKEKETAETEAEREAFSIAVKESENRIRTLEWKKGHLEHELLYLLQFDGENAVPVPEEYYVLSWEFDETKFPGELTETEILERAKAALISLYEQKSAALSQAGVSTRLLREDELIDYVKNHFSPLMTCRIRDYKETDYDGDFITEG